MNEYLSEVFPDASPLLPKSPAGRAKARIITSRSNDLTTAYFTYLTNKNDVSSGSSADVCMPGASWAVACAPLESSPERPCDGRAPRLPLPDEGSWLWLWGVDFDRVFRETSHTRAPASILMVSPRGTGQSVFMRSGTQRIPVFSLEIWEKLLFAELTVGFFVELP